jgi:hypothetical protein
MRADGEARYLYVLNSDLYENRGDEIVVKGIFPKVVDRGLVRPWLVPRRVEDGKTSFGLRLAPAEGTLIVLRP